MSFPFCSEPEFPHKGAKLASTTITLELLNYLGILITCRAFPATPGPVPVGGFRIPSKKSLQTTALLRCSSFAAKSNVSVYRFLARR